GTTLDINGNLAIADTVIDLDGFAPTIRATSGPLSLKGSGLEFEGTRSSSDAEFFRDLAEGGSANNGIFLFSYNSAVAGARYGRLWVTTTGVFRVDPSISNRLSLDTGAQNYLTAFEGSSSGENREFRIYGWNTALAAPAYGFLQYDDSSDRFRLGVSSGDLELDDNVFVIGNVGIRQDVSWPASLSLTPMSIITAYPGGTDPMTPGLLRLRAARDGTVALVDNGGNVGIGTATPQKTLDILSTGDDHLRLTYDASNYWD
ncbi:unnamed protein product, partial [marine sediment metagenome]